MTAAAGRSAPAAPGGSRGGLPEDSDLGAFAAAADGAFGPGPAALRPSAKPLAAVPAPSATPADEHPSPAAGPGADAQPGSAAADVSELPDVPHGDLVRQATIGVAVGVAERFRAYQRREAADGPALSNAEVIFRALEACRGRYAAVVASHQPQAAGRQFGAPVPGRRATSEARLSSQINYRPTYAEVAGIKHLQRESGAPSVSAFLDAVLDEFLPPLPGQPRG